MRTLLIAVALVILPATAAFAQDVCAPARVTDAAIPSTGRNDLIVTFTVTGDDCSTGSPSYYEIRYTTASSLGDGTWQSASYTTGSSNSSGSQCVYISGLDCNTTYYVAVFLKDEVLNRSPISNIASAATRPCNQYIVAECP